MNVGWDKERAIAYAREQLPRAKYFWVDPQGYIQFRWHRESTTKRFHRYITQRRLKKKLQQRQHVHHKDHDKLNNTPGNLKVLSIAEHNKLHPRVWTVQQKLEFSKARMGSRNPNYGNHKKRSPKPREEVERMRRNQPGYTHIDRDFLIATIKKYKTPKVICAALGVTYKIYLKRCRQHGFEYRLGNNEVVPIPS